MWSIIKRNIEIFFKKPFIVFLDLFCIILLFIDVYNNDFDLYNEMIYIITGTYNLTPTFLFISFALLINCSYIYLAYRIYKHDMACNKESIFLRISYSKWMTSNIFSILLIDIFLLFLSSLVFGIYISIIKVEISFHLFSLLIIFLSKLFLQLILIIFLKIIGNWALIPIIVILSVPLVFKTKSLVYIYSIISNNNILIVFLIMLIIDIVLILLSIFFKDKNLVLKGGGKKWKLN